MVEAKRAGTLVIAFAAEIDADVERAREKMRAFSPQDWSRCSWNVYPTFRSAMRGTRPCNS